MTNAQKEYCVRFKGNIETMSAQRLVELSRSGRISGVHDYSPDAGSTWIPVSRMEYEADDRGVWTIKDLLHAASPQPTTSRVVLPTEPATPPPTPHPHSGPMVVVNQPAPLATLPPPVIETANPLGVIAVAGFVLSLVGLLLQCFFLAARALGLVESMIGGVFAVLGVVLAACTIARPGRRGFSIAALAVGTVSILVCLGLLGLRLLNR